MNNRGFVLPIGLMFLAILAIIAIAVVIVTTTDLKIGQNYKINFQAFHNAEAGVHFAVQSIENGLIAGTFTLPEDGQSVSLGGFTIPDDFSFTLSALTRDGTANRYTFSSTAGEVVIEVKARKSLAIGLGVFGDHSVDMKASSAVYSYDSTITTNPTPEGSTKKGHVASNVRVSVKTGATIEGDVLLGDDGAGAEAVYTFTGTPLIFGKAGSDVERIGPDPLGLVGGGHAVLLAGFMETNDNDDPVKWIEAASCEDEDEVDSEVDSEAGSDDDGESAWLRWSPLKFFASLLGISVQSVYADEVAEAVCTSLDLHGSLTLHAGNYCFTDITLRNGACLNIDASAGQVNIWLTGKLEAKNGSSINCTGNPPDFSIFSTSTESLIFKHNADFKGLIYAPYAKVEVMNSGTLYGAVWANEIETKNSAIIYFDEALKTEYQTLGFEIIGWQAN